MCRLPAPLSQALKDQLCGIAVCVCGMLERHSLTVQSTFDFAPPAEPLGLGEITAHGLCHSAATILLNHVGKDLREIQELLRHKNIRTTVGYTHVGYEQTRQTADALSQALE
jgi:Phage integrase family